MLNVAVTAPQVHIANPNEHVILSRPEQSQKQSLCNEKDKPKQLVRGRTSAIDSPSDLILDDNRDSLLMTSVTKPTNHQFDFTVKYVFDSKTVFDKALELYNRTHCCKVDDIWLTVGSFFECKGPIRTVQRMCTRCHDIKKPKTKTDLYYVDLTERTKHRTVLCHGCMEVVIYREVGKDEHQLTKYLKDLRKQQKIGVAVIQL